MNDSLVSVLIPAYNHERYIEECVLSIVNQTYKELEIIISDDGSTDLTYQKILNFEKRYKDRFVKIDILHHQNVGVSSSLNMMLKRCSGQYIFIMASDDILKADAIAKMYDFLKNNANYVLVVGDNEIVDCESKRIYWNRFREASSFEQSRFKTLGESIGANVAFRKGLFGYYAELLKSNHIPNGYLIRYSAIKKIEGYNGLYPEDWNLHLQLSKIGEFRFISEILFSYRWHSQNTVKSVDYWLKSREGRKKQLLCERNWCFQHGLKLDWLKIWNKEFGFLGTINYYRKLLVQINCSKGMFVIKLFRRTIIRF